MPTETFLNLSDEKKQKIIKAAKKEFSRASLEESSIKNIVEEAGIARGSFYQYFESKEDLLYYLMTEQIHELEDFVQKSLHENQGDIFLVYLELYDFITEKMMYHADIDFHKKIFENIKECQEYTMFLPNPDTFIKGPFQKKEFIQMINTENLKVENEEDLKIVIKMMYLITKKALVSNFKYDSVEKSREEYLKMMEYLKNGVLK